MTGASPEGLRLRRVLVLLPSAGLGGAEAMTAVLARALHAAGIVPEIAIAPALAPGFAAMLGPGLAAAIAPAPLDWQEEEPAGQGLRRQQAVAAARMLAARPDAVVIPLPWPSHGLGFLAPLREAGVPTLLLAHLAPREPDPAMAEAARLAPPPRWPGLVWAAVSAPVAARVEAGFALPRGRVQVVPNGVPLPSLPPGLRAAQRAAKRGALGLDEAAPLLVVAGRLEPKKGTDLLPGLARALRRRAGATLAVLGEGPAGTALEAQDAARLASQGRGPPLRLLGRVPDVGDWLLAADALLLPSRLEGCPLVFLEAAARRCPVVATEAALEAHGEAAWDIAAIAPDGLASALVDQAVGLLASPARRALQAEAAWRLAAAWDEAAMTARLLGLLRGAAGMAAAARQGITPAGGRELASSA
jgi:glycosyltransferase involved in cell wall biosynthesis